MRFAWFHSATIPHILKLFGYFLNHSPDESEDDRFLGIMEDIYKYRYREFPEHGSFVGFHDYDDKLESFTMAAFQRRKVFSESFVFPSFFSIEFPLMTNMFSAIPKT